MNDGKAYAGFVVLESEETVTLRDSTGVSREHLQANIEDRVSGIFALKSTVRMLILRDAKGFLFRPD